MSTLAGDFWVCGECRSINNAGANQCYNCRTQKDRAAVDPETIDPTSAGKPRAIELPPFRATRGVAMLATIGIVAIALMQAYDTFIMASVYQLRIDGAEIAPNQVAFANTVGVLTLGIAALALIGWSLWLSRVVTAMPALGLGYPPADGFRAFVENFLPVLNLYRVPAIVRDVVHRLEPGTVRGEALFFGSWLALLGGFLVPRIIGAVAGTSLQSGADALRTTTLVAIVASVLVALGAVGLIARIWWVEGRIARRREAQLAEAGGAATAAVATSLTPASAGGPAQAVAMPSAFAATGSLSTEPAVSTPTAAAAPDQPRFSLPQVEPPPPPDDAPDDAWDQVIAQRSGAAPVEETVGASRPEDVPATAVEIPRPGPPVTETAPMGSPEPIEAAASLQTAAHVESTEPDPAGPGPVQVADAAPPEAESTGPPHLTIKVGARGMITAELDGEAEHIILDDLTAYGDALAKVDGTAAIHIAPDDPMAGLIARRAQKILDDAGVQVTVD